MRHKRLFLPMLCALCLCALPGCKAVVPKLDPMKAEAPVNTVYTEALSDLNQVLEASLPPDYPDTFFSVKPVVDSTGLSATGEIPGDITAMVRDAISQVTYKVRHVESYDQSDIQNMQAQMMILQLGKMQGMKVKQAERPAVDYTIDGRISQFDRNLESTADKSRAMFNVGEGLSRTDASASAERASRLSRLAVSFSVFKPSGVSLPGKFGASMQVQYAKNGFDIGFAIFGNGLGFGAEATAMHGRHMALQMLTEFSVVQIIGRALNVPYWRVGASRSIFTRDRLVLDNWSEEYRDMGSLRIPYMQAQCISNGDSSVAVTGQLDAATRAAFDRFAEQYGVANRVYPNFELFCALEENRVLDGNVSRRAWGAYQAYKGGSRPAAAPQPAPAAAPRGDAPKPKPAAAPARERKPSGGGSAPARDNNPFGGLL